MRNVISTALVVGFLASCADMPMGKGDANVSAECKSMLDQIHAQEAQELRPNAAIHDMTDPNGNITMPSAELQALIDKAEAAGCLGSPEAMMTK